MLLETNPKSVKVFLSYSHKDERYKNQLLTHLNPLIRSRMIEPWDDRKSVAGEEWEKDILLHIDNADIIICLLSPDFLGSDYCNNVEVKRAWERKEKEGIKIIPILLRFCNWQETLFKKLQIIPRDNKPILDNPSSKRDKMFVEIARDISKVIESINANHA